MLRPLDDIRILDLTQGMCGPFCTQILRDFGAEVIKIEPPAGDVSRRMGTRHGKTSISYVNFNRGKKSVILEPGKPEQRELLLRLAERADVFVEDMGAGKSSDMGIGYEEIRKRKPDILYLSITGYGHEGMFRNYSDLDAIVQALSGFMSITGEIGGEYTKAGVPIADIYTGIYGAIGVLAGIIHRRKTGGSLYIDLAKLNVMLTEMPDVMSKYFNTGQATRPKGCRHQLVGFFGPAETKDGSVICMAAQDHQFKAMTEILGLEGLEKDERFNSMTKRCANIAQLEPIIYAKTRELTMDELTEKLLERKIPAGQINTLDKILESDYVKYHGLTMEVTDKEEGTFRVVGSPMRFEKFDMPGMDFVSQPGEFTEEILREIPGVENGGITPVGETAGTMSGEAEAGGSKRPLEGIRILDLTRFMAGPLGIQILENLGAEIIKVERDGGSSEFCRNTEPTFGTTSAYFMAINSGKKDIALDFNKEEHREIFLRLAEKCDIVADNFRPGVTEKLHIAYEDVKKRNPDIIYSTVSGFGYTGPYRTRGCVDTVAQAMSGFMSLTGKAEGEPVRGGSSIADVCSSLYEAAAILASVIYRDRTGEGGFVDSPMLSSMLTVSDGMSAEYLNHGTKFLRNGNRDRRMPLFRAYPALDGEVMIEAEEHFDAFVKLLGCPQLSEKEVYKDREGRHKNLDELEVILCALTRRKTMTELADSCRKAGIPAGEVNTLERISRSGYIEQQHMVCRVHDSKEGSFKVLGMPLKFDKFEVPDDKSVPQPGEHTAEILKGILGMPEEEIQRLF